MSQPGLLPAVRMLGSEPGRPHGFARYLLCVISLLGNTEERRNNRVGEKAPFRTPTPWVFPSFQDCDLNFIQLCPFSDSFLVPKDLELGTVAASAL